MEFDELGLDFNKSLDGPIPELNVENIFSSLSLDTPLSVKNVKTSEIVMALDVEPSVVFEQIDNGFVTDLEEKTRQVNLTNFITSVKGDVVLQLVDDNDPVSKLSKPASEMNDLKHTLHPSTAALIYSSKEDNIFKNIDRQTLQRLQSFQRILQNQFETSDSGFINGVGYLVDMIVSFPKDVLTGGGFTRDMLAQELFTLATDTSIPIKEAEERVKIIAQQVADTGFFSDNNWFYTGQLVDDFLNHGGNVDKFFTVLDVIGLGAVAKGVKGVGTVGGKLLRLRTSDDIAAATGDADKAKALVEHKAVSGDVSEVAKTVSPAFERPTDTNWIDGFFNAAGRKVLVDKEVDWRISEIVSKKDFGGFIQQDVWERIYPGLVKEGTERAKALGNNRLIDYNVTSGLTDGSTPGRLGNPLGTAIYGTTKGKFYSNTYKYKAQAFADEIGGEVVPVMQEGKQMWAVKKEWNIPTDSMFDELKHSELATNMFQILGSVYLTTSKRLDAIAKRGESQLAGSFKEIMSGYNSVRRNTPKQTRTFVDDLFTELRDGVEAERRTPLSMSEFRTRYYQKFGKKATESDELYFKTISDINNTAYLLLADRFFKQAVNAEGKILRANNADVVVFPVKKLDSVPTGKAVFNVDTNLPMEMPKDMKGVFLAQGGYDIDGTTFKYIYTENGTFRRLYHNDVLPYNVGGPRVYDEFKHFVGQEVKANVAGHAGTVPREMNFIGVRTEKEAIKVVDEINTLFKAIRDRVKPSGSMKNDLQRIRALASDNDFNLIVARNTLWNDGINSVDDLVDFLESRRLDYSVDVKAKPNGGRLRDELNFFAGDNDAGTEFIRQAAYRTRSDTPLLGYGDRKASVLPPHVAIERNFTRQLTSTSNSPYTKNAVAGWLKGASKAGVINEAVDPRKSPLQQLLDAKVNTGTEKGRRFAQEQNVIRRRLGNRDSFSEYWQSTVGQLADWIYDNTKFKNQAIKFENVFSENPLHAMRAMAFHLKLGLFAFDQIIVQSNQMVNVVTIGGVNGLKGAALYTPLHMAMYNGTKPVADYIGTRIASFVGLKPEDFSELVEFMKKSGRFDVGREVAEQDMNFRLTQGVIGRGLEAGRMFFNEGERVARTSAAAVAYMNFKQQFPGAKLLGNQNAINYMTHEMDRLTAGMTSSSASAWQRNSLSAVPLQFMSYTARMTEQLLSNRILTKWERRRLAIAQTFFWGLTGVGLGWTMDAFLRDNDDVSLNRDMYTALRYGALDFIVGSTTESRTAFAERLAFPDAIFNLWEDMTEGNFMGVIAGPSGDVGSSIAGDVISTLGHAFHNRYTLAGDDLKAMAKNIATFSKATQAYHLFTVGKYYSRRGSEVADGFSNLDAIFHVLGAPLQDVSFAYETVKDQKKREEALNEVGYFIQDKLTQAATRYANNDDDGARQLISEVASMINVYDDVFEKDYLRKFLKPNSLNLAQTVIKKEMEAGNTAILTSRTGE